MSPLRVLVITPDFPPAKGGIQILSHRLVSCLRRFEPTVVTLGQPGARAFDAQQPFRVLRVPAAPVTRAFTILALNVTASAAALRRRPDVVLSLHIVAAPAAAALRCHLRIPFVQYVHAKELGAKPGLARFALTRADRVVAVSNYTRRLAIQAGGAPDRIALIHPGVDLPTSVPTPSWSRRPTVLTISRLEDRYKGHDVMLRALPLVRASVPEVRWRVIGDGPLRPALEDRAHASGLAGVVRFLGAVSDEARNQELTEADVFCMVSRLPAGRFAGEGFGIVYLEANSYGLPVVAGRVGGATDAVIQGATGLLVDPDDHVAVADAIATLLGDSRLAQAMGRNGYTRAEELSWAAAAQQLESELEHLIA